MPPIETTVSGWKNITLALNVTADKQSYDDCTFIAHLLRNLLHNLLHRLLDNLLDNYWTTYWTTYCTTIYSAVLLVFVVQVQSIIIMFLFLFIESLLRHENQ